METLPEAPGLGNRDHSTAGHFRTASSESHCPQEQETELPFPTQRNRHRDLGKMRRPKKFFQMKEQDKVIAGHLSKTDTSNMSDGGFKSTIIRIEERIQDIS